MDIVPELQTVAAKRSAQPRFAEPGDLTTLDPKLASDASIGSPIEALERDEIMRTRAFSVFVVVLAVVASVAGFVVPGGNRRALQLLLIACSAGVFSMAFLLYQTLDPIRFRQRRTALIWFVPVIVVNAAVYYFGVFSPAPMVVVLGIYFVGLGKAHRMAIAAYVGCAVMLAAMALVPILGGRDLGVAHPDLTRTQMIITIALEQIVLATTIVVARTSRRTALAAVGELEQAVRLAAHRQALLLEARDELERALGSKRGRFSAQTIGHYQLGELLGRGAMGEVYAAVDTRNGGEAALKLISQASLGNAEHVLRFIRELRTAASVESPHVVRVLEVGEQPVPYLVMERLDGRTLADVLRERRTLTPEEVVELIRQIGIGITAAAAAGIVHRDLKPPNVFDHRGVWKILDFGVARALDHGDTLTAGHVVGTPAYMAPEQARGGTVDHRTDLYALAATAYRALTGYPPFAAKEVAETLYRVVHTRPVRPSLLVPELRPEVDLVLAIGMAPEPGDRFVTATAFSEALDAAFAGHVAPMLRAHGIAVQQAAPWSSALKRRA
ncbi:MAG: serine/threonine-protein kinase [Kofleriaceae bacterium]|nr:serine/threonine-protein kinase [Kofleriaceae bacterium]